MTFLQLHQKRLALGPVTFEQGWGCPLSPLKESSWDRGNRQPHPGSGHKASHVLKSTTLQVTENPTFQAVQTCACPGFSILEPRVQVRAVLANSNSMSRREIMADEPKLATADELRPMPQRDDARTEYLLKLTSDRVNGLESALEKNWIAHLVLAATGLALVFHIGSFRDLLSNYFIMEDTIRR